MSDTTKIIHTDTVIGIQLTAFGRVVRHRKSSPKDKYRLVRIETTVVETVEEV